MTPLRLLLCVAMCAAWAAALPADEVAAPADPFAAGPTIRAPAVAEAREQATAWLESISADEGVRAEAARLWDALPAEADAAATLDAVAATCALGDPRAAKLVAHCATHRTDLELPDMAWLSDEQTPAFERYNLRLLYGRWLAHERLFDEALTALEGIQPADVVDPASLLFFQGVACHTLSRKEPGLSALRMLLDETGDAPPRYTAVATLMRADLEGLEPDSLNHISRQMGDVERRLDLGHAGPRIIKVEDDIIAALDKLIEELEQQQQSSSSSSSSGGTIRSRSPAQRSQILTGKGPGDVEHRDIGSGDGWGDLPEKEREEAIQQIGKDFPSHYREAIEQYFRALAGGEEEPAE
jgi:hypothetical protein